MLSITAGVLMQAFCARSLRAFQVGQIITLDLFLLPLFGIYVYIIS